MYNRIPEIEVKKEQFDIWYGDDRYRTKSFNEYVCFLKNIHLEILYQIAYLCKHIRELEIRNRLR